MTLSIPLTLPTEAFILILLHHHYKWRYYFFEKTIKNVCIFTHFTHTLDGVLSYHFYLLISPFCYTVQMSLLIFRGRQKLTKTWDNSCDTGGAEVSFWGTAMILFIFCSFLIINMPKYFTLTIHKKEDIKQEKSRLFI